MSELFKQYFELGQLIACFSQEYPSMYGSESAAYQDFLRHNAEDVATALRQLDEVMTRFAEEQQLREALRNLGLVMPMDGPNGYRAFAERMRARLVATVTEQEGRAPEA